MYVWVILGLRWVTLGPHGVLGITLKAFVISLNHFGGNLGAHIVHFGQTLVYLGSILAHFEVDLAFWHLFWDNFQLFWSNLWQLLGHICPLWKTLK